nr:MAG: capsid protein [Owegonang virus 13]
MPASKRNPARKQMKRRPRRKVMPNEYAKVTETHEFTSLVNNVAYYDYETSLARCERAATIASGFQEYKISKVEYHFMPLTDTFQPTGAGVPNLFFRIDKTGALEHFTTASQLAQTGCKPRRLDDKIVKVSYKPAVLQYARDEVHGTNPWSKPITSPWLSTNANNTTSSNWVASSIDHLGLAWIVEQVLPPGIAPTNYTIRQLVHFEFRKPNVLNPVSPSGTAAVQAGSINSPEAV